MGEYSELAKLGNEAISLCLSEYASIKGESFPPEVDRAYIHAGQDMLGIVFSRGETGTFGKRDANYQAFVSCGVGLQPAMHVQDLREGYSILKERDVVADDTAFYEGHIDELLYLRDGVKFNFSQGQVFSSERIDALQFPEQKGSN